MNSFIVAAKNHGMRLDVYLAEQLPALSRSRIRTLIEDGHVETVPPSPLRPRTPVRQGLKLVVALPPPAPTTLTPEAVALDILYEDDDLVVLNKPAGMVVHPAAGCVSGTLVNALLHHCPDLPGINGWQRPGIVHRLDKDTSGAIVAAKSEQAMRALAAQFKNREIEKEYRALACGIPRPAAGRIETLIGRDTRDRKKMAARPASGSVASAAKGRHAVTAYEVLETFGAIAWLRLRIETGRTHQIRVHLAHIGHPVLGDRTYGGRRATTQPPDLDKISKGPPPCPSRQMLHAYRLAFRHPIRGTRLDLTAPLPPDMDSLLKTLRFFYA